MRLCHQDVRVHVCVTPREKQARRQEHEKPLQDIKTKCVCACVCLHMSPSLAPTFSPVPPLSSLSRVPSPTIAFAPRPLPLSPPSLLKAREAPEDRLGQVAQLRVSQVKDAGEGEEEGGAEGGKGGKGGAR